MKIHDTSADSDVRDFDAATERAFAGLRAATSDRRQYRSGRSHADPCLDTFSQEVVAHG